MSFGPAIASLPFLLHVGPLSAISEQLEAGRLLTDDRPWIQFDAPLSHCAREAGLAEPFVGARLADLQRAVRDAMPVARDPYLARLTASQRGCVEAGLYMYEYAVRFDGGEHEAATRALAAFIRAVPDALRPAFGDWVK